MHVQAVGEIGHHRIDTRTVVRDCRVILGVGRHCQVRCGQLAHRGNAGSLSLGFFRVIGNTAVKKAEPDLAILDDIRTAPTTRELSTMIKVPVGTLHQWRSRGIGPPCVRVGRTNRYPLRGLAEWLSEHQQ